MTLEGRISLHKLVVFALVVELDSVSRAAERLVVTQPVVSAHLRSLEEALGCELYQQRGGRRVLTEAGVAVNRFAQETLRGTRELERRMTAAEGDLAGRIVLAASMTIGTYRVGRASTRFLATHPGVAIELQSADADRLVHSTITGAVDFAVALDETGVSHDALHAEVIGSEPFELLAAPGTFPTGPLEPARLSEASFVEDGIGDGSAAITRALREVGVRRRVTMQLGHPEAVKRVIAAGAGVAFLPLAAATREIAVGALDVVAVRGLELSVPVQVIYRAGRELTASEDELVAELRAEYASVAPAHPGPS